LKPPGGGSSDIFAGQDPLTTPRSIKNHMRSNIFSEASPAKNSTGKKFTKSTLKFILKKIN
jgi:hypothetical protein